MHHQQMGADEMKQHNRIKWAALHAVLIGGVIGFSGGAFAAQPPDVVVSDSNHNSAMGTGALSALTTGANNTALRKHCALSTGDSP